MYSKKKSDAAIAKTRENGKFVKGVSGNPAGRPKKPKAAEISSDFHSDIGDDSIKTLRKLMVTTNDRYEKAKLAKELAPYDAPKKASIESYSTEIKTIEIKWVTDESPAQVIEGEVLKEITDEG